MIVITGSVALLMKKHATDNIIVERAVLDAVRAKKFAPSDQYRYGEN